MKIKNIALILLIVFITSMVVANIDLMLPNTVSATEKLGTIAINDFRTEKTTIISYEAKGKCYKVVDGDTIWVEGVGKIRFVGVDTPERGQTGYKEAKNFVKQKCLGKTVYLDIDDAKNKDRYNRTLAVVYVDNINLNKELLYEDYARIMFIPPSQFSRGLGTLNI